MTTVDPTVDQAVLPTPRGPLSAVVIDALRADPPADLPSRVSADPYGEDLQLALHVCYELHYQGFAGVSDDWEWNPELLRFRTALERVFLGALRADVPGGADIAGVLDELLVEPVDGVGVSHYLKDEGEWWQMREYLALRSIYHLKEADPHAWVIPRLRGPAKAALVAVEFDEFGGGRADRMHSRLFADLLVGAGLHDGYLHYLEHAPAETLATVNLMSLCGLHRSLRGALVGHFAAAEITTAPSAARMAKALERLDAHPDCVEFFTEHIEADAVHEQVMRRDVIGDLLAREPELTESVVFGVQATELLEQRLGDHLLNAWKEGRTALRLPL
ncbi:iron-containing redox enzyme family protein [Saccharothrix deserti]|uniref:iron-containing redox enzyme family protein n=1 Tax=Saccharothrix deserti TaxID=2593674 RepID=UPI00131C0BD3|nr:iron-containing redox enzyme family protein [Saccharothrix deserti]